MRSRAAGARARALGSPNLSGLTEQRPDYKHSTVLEQVATSVFAVLSPTPAAEEGHVTAARAPLAVSQTRGRPLYIRALLHKHFRVAISAESARSRQHVYFSVQQA